MQVAGDHERQRRAAFAGIGPKPRRFPSGQAGVIAIAPLQDLPVEEDDIVLQPVLLDVVAQALELRQGHGWKEFGMRMDRQMLLGHGSLRSAQTTAVRRLNFSR